MPFWEVKSVCCFCQRAVVSFNGRIMAPNRQSSFHPRIMWMCQMTSPKRRLNYITMHTRDESLPCALMSSAVECRQVQGNQMEYINIHLMVVIDLLAMVYLNENIILLLWVSERGTTVKFYSGIAIPLLLGLSCEARLAAKNNCSWLQFPYLCTYIYCADSKDYPDPSHLGQEMWSGQRKI